MNRDHRILTVSPAEFGGGATASAWNLFNRYRQLGYQSWLAVGYKETSDPNVFVIPNAEKRNFWVRYCRGLQSAGKETKIAILTDKLGRLANLGEPRRVSERFLGVEDFHHPGTRHVLALTPVQPTILHCHNLHGGYFDLRALPSLSSKVPVILNLRDAWMLSGHCAHSFGCDRWRNGCGHCPDLKSYPAVRRDSTAYNWKRKADIYRRSRLYVTTPSQWLMDQVNESMLQWPLQKVIANGIDTDVFFSGDRRFARQALGLPRDGVIILVIAHNAFKDLVAMKAALATLTENHGSRLTFVCLGVGKPDEPLGRGIMVYRQFERELARMRLYYQAANIYLHIAKAEAFGRAIVEAMLCGAAVVANAVGGIPEILSTRDTGLLVGDSSGAVSALAVLVSDPQLRDRLSARGREHAHNRFSLVRQAADFLDWYGEVKEDWVQWLRDSRV